MSDTELADLPLARRPATAASCAPPLPSPSLAALAGCSVTEPPAPPPVAQPELMKWPALLERPRPEPDSTFAYGDDQMQKVDLWLPAGRGPHPTVLMVHGGCWQTEIADRRIMNWIADDLRTRGIAVWNIDYRGVDRAGGGYPGTFADAAAAADALRGQAAATGSTSRRSSRSAIRRAGIWRSGWRRAGRRTPGRRARSSRARARSRRRSAADRHGDQPRRASGPRARRDPARQRLRHRGDRETGRPRRP